MAGSHGFSDLVAIDKIEKTIRFIQVKPDKFSALNERRLNEENDFCNGRFECSFEVL